MRREMLEKLTGYVFVLCLDSKAIVSIFKEYIANSCHPLVEDIHQLVVETTVENQYPCRESRPEDIFCLLARLTHQVKLSNNFYKYPFRNCLSARPYILFNLYRSAKPPKHGQVD